MKSSLIKIIYGRFINLGTIGSVLQVSKKYFSAIAENA